MILAIDPGPINSAYVVYLDGDVLQMDIVDNYTLREMLISMGFGRPVPNSVVIEGISSYGMAVGKTVFETVQWVGRFIEAYPGNAIWKINRPDVKLYICKSRKAKDSNIIQALVDRYGGLGGMKAAKGTKNDQGPLYGIKADIWQALALAITFDEAIGVAEKIRK